MNGYIDAIRADQKIKVQLRDKTITIYRAKFRDHLLLARLRKDFADCIRRDMATEAKAIFRLYFLTAGITEEMYESMDAKDALFVYLLLVELNSFKIELPFLTVNESDNGDGTQDKKEEPLPYDYPDRQWAKWITFLAETFGWTRNDIFEMYPEEVACYMQEAIVITYFRREDERSLSKVSYKYDEGSKKYSFIPTPMPFWMSKELMKEETKVKIRKDMLPAGNVIDLSAVDKKKDND